MTAVLTAIAVITLLSTVAAAVGGSWKLSRNTQSVNIYRENAQAWQQKAELQGRQISDLQAALAVKDAEVEALSARTQTLETVVTSRAEITELTVKTSELLALAGEIRAGMRAILTAYEKNSGGLQA